MSAGDLLVQCGVRTLGLCLLTSSALAQAVIAEPTESPDQTLSAKADGDSYSLSGTVINSITGEPIHRAAVQITGQNGSIVLTDNGGHFVMEGLAEGNVLVSAQKPGFYDGEASHSVAARVGKEAPSVVLRLTPWAVIGGRVTTKDDQPLEGFQVHVMAKQNVDGRLVWMDQPGQARTDDQGEFRIAGLQSGSYYVAVDQSAETTLSQRGVPNAREQIFAKVYYPGVSDLSAATPIDLSAGREAEVNFSLSAEPMYRVSGSVTGPASAIAGLTFARKAGNDADFTQTVTVQDGKFEAKLPAGAYSASGATGEGVDLSTPGAAVVIHSDDADLHIPLNTTASIPVEFEKEQGAVGSERRTPMQAGAPGVFLQLMSDKLLPRAVSWWRGQASGISNVQPGAYSVKINTMGEWWVKSAQSGSVDLLSDDLIVVEGGQPAAIEVTLRDDGAIVSGTVTPAGEPGQVIVLLVQPGRRNFMKVARTVQGNFVIQGVPPGEYAIIALEGGDRLEYANPEVLSPYLSNAVRINLRPHGNVTVTLSVTLVGR